MRENFTISIKNSYYFPNLSKILVSIILSIIIVYPILGVGTLESFLSFIILFGILYVIISSLSNENLSNELPSTLYPSLPHTGLDGISLNNYVAGMQLDKM